MGTVTITLPRQVLRTRRTVQYQSEKTVAGEYNECVAKTISYITIIHEQQSFTHGHFPLTGSWRT